MGGFGNAFKRELGKNAAKTISNLILGDSWSTPYRRVGKGSGSRTIRHEVDYGTVQMREMLHEEKMERVNATKQKVQIAHKNQLYDLDNAVLKNVDKLTAIEIPKNEDGIIAILRQLEINLEICKWENENNEEGHIRNQYSNALFITYQNALFALMKINKNNPNIAHYAEVYSNAENRKYPIFGTNDFKWGNEPIYRISNSSDRLFWQIYKLKNEIEQKDWEIIWKRDSFSKQRHNKWTDGLWNLYKSAYKTIQSHNDISSEKKQELMHEYKKLKRRRNRHKYLYIYLSFAIFLIIGIVISLCLIDSQTRNIILIAAAIIATISIGLFIYFKIKDKKVNKKSQELKVTTTEPIFKDEKADEGSTTTIEGSDKFKDIFIDLNENERIENRLSIIWEKYKTNSSILSRRPIFSADGVKNSILFVGVNPSFAEEDDNVLIESNDKKSLLYGSYYQREDAPIYFKALETFASQCGYPYTQINLLYARENDRNLLLKSNSNFIREQLELTYETIININPIAIVFFTDYCKQLIFGKDRWVNPDNLKNGAFILNGTQIPIFFSEDVTTINALQQQELIQQIKSVL